MVIFKDKKISYTALKLYIKITNNKLIDKNRVLIHKSHLSPFHSQLRSYRKETNPDGQIFNAKIYNQSMSLLSNSSLFYAKPSTLQILIEKRL